ncbi:hypothetical protein ACFPOI_35915 [Nonomuraea angiospora]|uniref:Uncharacterized protein n=1 Tax=Nonomuraea angiospora TaxID=46172 RepID=A0ABR9M8R7_9ACTN|nr:hypothetical protein [Nonomuraea angiospora]MBE1589308.1 hypothetical protein [Nonomuraea angiospora]
MSERYKNVAEGNARVGAQIGKVVGNVTVGSAPPREDDLQVRVAELRAAMRRSVASGALEAEVHEAAEAELAEVDAYLRRGGQERHGKMVLALKKVRGLLGDVADLASIAAVVLAVGQGLNR